MGDAAGASSGEASDWGLFGKLPRQALPALTQHLLPAEVFRLRRSCASGQASLAVEDINAYAADLLRQGAFALFPNIEVAGVAGIDIVHTLRYCRAEDVNAVHAYLAAGGSADVAARDGDVGEPLCTAAARNFTATVMLLLESRACPNTVGRDGLAALDAAISAGSTDTAKLLLDCGAQSSQPHDALRVASAHPATFAVCALRLIEDFGADADAAIDAAIEHGDVDMALSLMTCPGVSDRPWTRQWALRRAANIGALESVKVALELPGVDIENGAGTSVGSALVLAAEGGHTQVCRYLLEKRANVMASCSRHGVRRLPFDLAVATRNEELVDLLRSAEKLVPAEQREVNPVAREYARLVSIVGQGDFLPTPD